MKLQAYNASGTLITFDEFRNVDFAPEVDIMATQAIANYFTVEVKTDETLLVGNRMILKTFNDVLYADFLMTDIERIDGGFYYVKAQSDIIFLDKKIMKAKSYGDEPFLDVLEDILSGTNLRNVTVPNWTQNATLTGFVPKQTARERLTWICFVTGLYVRDIFCSGIELLSFSGTAQHMKYEHIFWKPKVSFRSHVTKISVTAFGFSTPSSSSQETVTDYEGETYQVNRYENSVTNQYAPESAPTNEIEISDCMLVTRSNVGDILTRLAQYYTNRIEVELDCINNKGDYLAGVKYRTYLSEDEMIEGFCVSCSYKKGAQTRSTLKLTGCAEVSTGKLTVLYKSQSSPNPPGALTVAKKEYHFPVGFQYTIETEWVDATIGNYRYIFRPASATVTGTMSSSNVTVTVQCYVCLIYDRTTKVLDVISVDEVNRTSTTEDGSTIYIAEIE